MTELEDRVLMLAVLSLCAVALLLVVEACARGEAGGGEVAVGDVAALLDVEASTASRLVDRAARAGLVHRAPSQVDSRRTALASPSPGVRCARATASRLGWLGTVMQG